MLTLSLSGDSLNTQILSHNEEIKKIIEVNSLEVNGVTEISQSNFSTDPAFGAIKNKLFGSKLFIQIPFTAKYGVPSGLNEMRVTKENGKSIITLKEVSLISFEMHLDKLVNLSEKGVFAFENNENFVSMQKKLYTDKKSELEKNVGYLKEAEGNLKFSLEKYFSSLGESVEIRFMY